MRKGWQTKKLGDVCATIQDGAHESPQRQFDSPGKGRFLYITSKNIRNNCLDLGNVSYVEADFHSRIYPRCKPSIGDVLLTKDGANTGNVTLNTLDEPFSLLSSICLIKTKPDSLSPGFLSYYIQSPDGLKSITGQMTGAAIKRIILRDIKLAPIPIPPLPEQQRIVAILDEAFEGLATATANAEQNLRNARALFESHLQSVFTQRGKGWVEKMLGDVCEFENGDRGKNYLHRSEYVESGIPWINTGHIQQDGTLSETEMNFISRGKYESLRSGKIQPGDLVYCLRGATLGKTALVDPYTIGAVASSLVILRPSSVLDSRYLYFFLTSPIGQGLIKGYENGAAQPNLGAKSVAKYLIALLPIAEQKQLVAKLDDLRGETKRLQSVYQQKLAAVNELKKSLLHQAFSGAL